MRRWTEKKWRQCSDLSSVLRGGLQQLSNEGVRPINERKLRQLMSAFVWRILQVYNDTPSRRVMVTMEQYAEGEIVRKELDKTFNKYAKKCTALDVFGFPWRSVEAYGQSLFEDVESAIEWVLHVFSPTFIIDRKLDKHRHEPSFATEEQRIIGILRDIIGNPFRPAQPLPDAVLERTDRLVVRLAKTIYDGRRWGNMPVLGAALLEAGCDNENLIAHCHQQEGIHTRGCWVIDLLLGKE